MQQFAHAVSRMGAGMGGPGNGAANGALRNGSIPNGHLPNGVANGYIGMANNKVNKYLYNQRSNGR